MSNKIKNSLTRREQRCLIDFDSISPNRHDYALILFCSRILVRVQLKCFEESANDVKDIVLKEAEYFPSRLQEFALLMRQNGYAYNLGGNEIIMMLHQITSAKNPLDTIRSILAEELATKSRNINTPPVKSVYRNLINLIDDLQKYCVNRASIKNKHKIRPIYFIDNYFIYQEGAPGGDDETYISFPMALVWLPTLTIKDEINQKNASAFCLRKKPEFIGNKQVVPIYRSQLLRMGTIQKRVSRNKKETPLKSQREKRRKRQTHNNGDQSRSTTILERSVPVTSIHAILNHVDDTINSN